MNWDVDVTNESTVGVLCDIYRERRAQDARWGEQNHRDGTGLAGDVEHSNRVRERCDKAFEQGRGTWRHILDEEVAEAFACSDPRELRHELEQVAAVAAAWIEALDRRSGGKP